jgi:hypothetical protein
MTSIYRHKAHCDIEAVEATDQLLVDCQFIGTGCNNETMANVRLYIHTPTGVTIWV